MTFFPQLETSYQIVPNAIGRLNTCLLHAIGKYICNIVLAAFGEVVTKENGASRPAAVTRDVEVQSQQSVGSDGSAAMISNNFDNYLTVREYPISMGNPPPHNNSDIRKQSGIYYKAKEASEHSAANTFSVNTARHQRAGSFYHDSRETPTINFRILSQPSTAAGAGPVSQQRRKSDRQPTLNQTNNASRVKCQMNGEEIKIPENSTTDNNSSVNEQCKEKPSERQQIFQELREWKKQQDKRIAIHTVAKHSNTTGTPSSVAAILTQMPTSSAALARHTKSKEKRNDVRSGILKISQTVTTITKPRGNRRVALQTNLPTYRSDQRGNYAK